MSKTLARKQDNRGGRRAGAGRKPSIEYSEDLKKNIAEALERKEKEAGVSFGDIIVATAFDSRQPMTSRLACFQMIQRALTVKESHVAIDKKELHAVVMLPPVQQTPQMFVEGAGPVINGETGEVVGDGCKV